MLITDLDSFNEFFQKVQENPKAFLSKDPDTEPRLWHLNYFNHTEKNRDIYTLYWKNIVIAKIKIKHGSSEQKVSFDQSGFDFFLKNDYAI